ncbi:MAG: hypothetical protein ACFE7R_01495 [Candidatus Hodarchaeota archaeon]
MTEEKKKFPRKKPAVLSTVRSLSASTEGTVKIIGLVIESTPGNALIQDIYDDVESAGRIVVNVEGTLNESEKYLIIGEVTQRTGPEGTELRLIATLAYNVNTLDIKLYRQTLQLEEEVIQALSR